MMKTFNLIAGVASIAVAMLSTTAVASTSDKGTALTNGSYSSQVHRISRALAGTSSYKDFSDAGYKWGRDNGQAEPTGNWSETAPRRTTSYKWGNSSASTNTEASNYAGAVATNWGSMSVSEQAGYRWGHRNTSSQVGYRWGHRNTSDQVGYRWGHRNTSDQVGYRWGHR